MHVKATNGIIDQYPYTVGQLRRDNPRTSFPKRISEDTLAGWGVFPVVVQDQPVVDARTKKLAQDATPSLVSGAWVLGWSVTDKTPQEVADYDGMVATSVRSRRDALLADTDYLALTDTTMTLAMTQYRQALRDITAHANFPYLDEADWPVKPV